MYTFIINHFLFQKELLGCLKSKLLMKEHNYNYQITEPYEQKYRYMIIAIIRL